MIAPLTPAFFINQYFLILCFHFSHIPNLSLSNNQTWSAGPDMTYIDTTIDGETVIASSGGQSCLYI